MSYTFTYSPANTITGISGVLDGDVITIPASNPDGPTPITTIQSCTFLGPLSGVTLDLSLPDNLTIGENAFQLCPFTGSLTIPNTVNTIGAGAFQNAGFTTTLSIGTGISTIPNSCFANCQFTGPLIIPENVTAIGDGAFYNNSGFTDSLTIPDTVTTTTIGAGAFELCGFTDSLTIPDNVTTIGAGAFKECGFTESLNIGTGISIIPNGCFQNCQFTGPLIIPENVTAIGDGAFELCESFTGSLTIPDSVTIIGANAFNTCGFTSLNIGTDISTIPNSCFANCQFTGPLIIPENVTAIGEFAFLGLSFISSCTLPPTLQSISTSSFSFTTNPTMTAPLGTPFNLTVIPESGTTLSISSVPAGLTANVITGEITGNITDSGNIIAEDSGSNTLTINVTVVPPVCFLETCNLMLTDGSYKNVKSIKTGDILRSALNGKDLCVLHCGHTVISDLSPVPTSNHPMCIPEGFFAVGSPARDVFISGHHRVFFALNDTTVGIQVFKLLPETNTLTMDKALEAVGSYVLKYYHVEVEGGKNAVFCDGLPVETLDVGEWSYSHIENQ